ncbi:glycosyltransferase [Methylosarcina fibrata]|uniref:glycosyltransferase n=1 Tax=Methylosarcina fibrata TaxID=105972 RepID=UPI000377748D|nr:glycosyltransferase [Methylosarcina fibrata]
MPALDTDKPSEKIKVLWITSSYPRFEHDSAAVFLRRLADFLLEEGVDLHVLSPDDSAVERPLPDDLIKNYRFRYFFPRRLQLLAYGSGILPNLRARPWLFLQIPFFLLGQFWSARSLIRRIEPDLIHAHWLFPQGWIAAWLGRRWKVPVIVTVHGGDAFSLQQSALAGIKRWTVHNCSTWTSNTAATAQAVGDRLPKPEIIPMGVDSRRFNSGTVFTKSPEVSVILFVGRLVEKKGVRDLIHAYAMLDGGLRDRTELWIVGDGVEREALERLASELKLTAKIHFHGRLPNEQLPHYYAAADVFIAPSITDSSGDTEGQGVILLEALASGTAIISTRTGGIGEVLEHGKTGLLVRPNDPVELKAAIENLLNDRKLRDSLAAEGQKIVSAYDWRLIAGRFAELYRRQLQY